MTTPTATARPTSPADEVASAIVALAAVMGDALSRQSPRLGHVDEQVRSEFDRHRRDWRRLVGDAMTPDGTPAIVTEGLVDDFGEHIADGFAASLAAAMDVQLARGWHPGVAWQRALSGLGLPTAALVAHVATPVGKDSEPPLMADGLRARARHGAVTHACRLAGEQLGCVANALREANRSEIVKTQPDVAGLAIRAADTGRVLMLQRALDDKDPAAGRWEFPGGHAEKDESLLDAARREWSEEVGRRVPALTVTGHWTHGRYRGFVGEVPDESVVPIHRGRGSIVNPDDPDGDAVEQLAWWDVDLLARNPAVRDELRDSLPAVRRALGTVAKAGFDENQARDADGKWTAGANAARRLKVAERGADTDSDRLLREVTVADKKPDDDNPYASLANDNSYAALANPYAALDNPYAALAENPYASLVDNPYASLANDNPYAALTDNPYAKKRRPLRIVRRLIIVPHALRRGERPDPDAGGTVFLPITDLEPYYFDSGRDPQTTLRDGHVVDFADIRAHASDVRGGTIRPTPWVANTPWDVIEGSDVDEADWAELRRKASVLWQKAQDDPIEAAENLSTEGLQEAAANAGYPISGRKAILDQIRRDAAAIDDGEMHDSELIDSLADYAVWQEPEEVFGDEADVTHRRHAGQGGVDVGEFAREVRDVLGPRYRDRMTPKIVFAFPDGVADGDDPHSLSGRYVVDRTDYESGLAGFGPSVAPGVIGIRVVYLKPDTLATDQDPMYRGSSGRRYGFLAED